VTLDVDLIAREFPVTRNTVFLNHAGTSPVSARVARTLCQFWETLRDEGPAAVRQKLTSLSESRKAVAEFVSASPEEVAFVSRTTEGVNIVAHGLDWKPGDNVVVPETEYPATVYPWMNLQDRRVEIRWVPEREYRYPVDAVMESVNNRTRAVVISSVEFASGYRFPLDELGAACRSRDVLFLVDAMQGAGVFRVDMQKSHIDALFCGVHKWILGPTGIAFFVCRRELMDRLNVLYVGADSVVDAEDYLHYDLTLRDDAARFEYGMVNYAGIAGIHAALSLIDEVGLSNIEERVHEITDHLVSGLRTRGFRVHSPRGEGEWSGIVSCTHPKREPVDLHRDLLRENIITQVRGGMLRFSPTYYNTEEQIDRTLEVLDR
jgi:cysteine desulfurase/selenocysteine lyase